MSYYYVWSGLESKVSTEYCEAEFSVISMAADPEMALGLEVPKKKHDASDEEAAL